VTVRYFRAPGGDFGKTSATLRQLCRRYRTRPLGWSVDPQDRKKPGVTKRPCRAALPGCEARATHPRAAAPRRAGPSPAVRRWAVPWSRPSDAPAQRRSQVRGQQHRTGLIRCERRRATSSETARHPGRPITMISLWSTAVPRRGRARCGGPAGCDDLLGSAAVPEGQTGGRSIVDDRSQGASSAAPGWVDATDRPSLTWPRAAGNAPRRRRRPTGRSPGFSATITAGRCLTPHGPGHPAAGRRNAEPARHPSTAWAQRNTDWMRSSITRVHRAPTRFCTTAGRGTSYRGPGTDGDLGHCR